nr:hypothetical protein [Mycoplasmopsis bovis]QQH18756.1 hypothetical protein HYE49_00945 [Mycoplasmopsis bovis]
MVTNSHKVDIERKDEEKGFLTQAECYTKYPKWSYYVIDKETGKNTKLTIT